MLLLLRLGGSLVALEAGYLQSNTGESIEDTARVLGLDFDSVVARRCEPTKQLRQIAELGRMRVVNAMSEEEHPSQVIGDFATLAQHFGDLEGLRLMYVGEGNNTANALVLAAAKIPGMQDSRHAVWLRVGPQVPRARMSRGKDDASPHRRAT